MSTPIQQKMNATEEQPKDISWFASFKDRSMELEFRDSIWNSVYRRYRLLFIIMGIIIGALMIQRLVTAGGAFTTVMEVGVWVFVMLGLYWMSSKPFFQKNHDRLTIAVLSIGITGETFAIANRGSGIMQEHELLLGLMILIFCYIVFPFNLLMSTMLALIWLGCHLFTFLVMPLLGLLDVPASAEAKTSAVIFTLVGWLSMFFYHKELETSKRVQFALLKEINTQKEEIKQTFNKYMGGTVADSILSDDVNTDGEERWVTVLFTDLRGYSTISEPMSPKEVLSMLNEYFSEMVPIVEKYEGVVLEYIGDAMMIVFGAPKGVEMHQEKAVRCAMEMREHLKTLNDTWNERELSRYWKNQDIETLDARAGIHTGNVVAGNIGGDRVMKYGAIGDVVNIAARLEQANKSIGSDILFSRSVYVALTKSLTEHCKDEGTMPLKGRSGEERVYSV